MANPWRWTELVFATRNRHKVEELDAMFSDALGIRVVGLDGFGDLPEIVEDRDTFEGNAAKKAENIAAILQRPVAADDSGLEVEVLKGAPGVYSARYSGPGATDARNNEKLLKELTGVPEEKRDAAFVCVLALAFPGEETRIVRGECHGRIAMQPRGEHGFGYDPLFLLPKRGCTMAELPAEVKNRISHRSAATKKMIQLLKEQFQFATSPASKE
ncbi:MAG: XTP/dITP diphosphatase [Firmicutes bacterium]|uniref:dITP/XTP pyrophosphatase n=1 Tax=Melghirimyces thermohalophilus TaxID=1236220 RepID=A0A1G6JRK4_9BACL|nr:XTP/dITP diphosphatase [Melghirimyces thermohalophilus]MDA8352536.1 XTP/dITP diphosphatase [Bacillota bacterium]SDC21364.1 XTP/dITP diphosphohydrolase [Melghirimyces thermohalophilus]